MPGHQFLYNLVFYQNSKVLERGGETALLRVLFLSLLFLFSAIKEKKGVANEKNCTVPCLPPASPQPATGLGEGGKGGGEELFQGRIEPPGYSASFATSLVWVLLRRNGGREGRDRSGCSPNLRALFFFPPTLFDAFFTAPQQRKKGKEKGGEKC